MQQSSWGGYRSDNIDPAQVLESESLTRQEVLKAPTGAELAYKSLDTSVCTVDEEGSVTLLAGAAPDTCAVSLTISADNFVDRVITAEVEVVRPNGTAWTGYDVSDLYVGERRLAEPFAGAPASATLVYRSLDEGVCTVDENSGDVTGVAIGDCVVALNSSRDGFLEVEIEQMLTVAPGGRAFAIAWTPASSGVVGVELTLDSVSGAPVDAVIEYAVKNAGTTGCAFKGNSGTDERKLIFATAGTCTVTASASLAGYENWISSDHAITVLEGALGNITWGSFTGTLEVGGSAKAPSAATGTGLTGGATVEYALKSGSEANCKLTDDDTGEVTAKAVDLSSTKTCTVVGTASRDGYAPTTGEISINLSPGTLGDVTWGTFSGTLQVGGSVQTPSAASGAGIDGATVSYALKSGSETNCDLTDSTTGEVNAKAVDLSSTQTCTIVGSVARTGYTTKTGDISIDLSAGVMGSLTGPAYTGTLAVMGTVSVTTAPSGAPDGAGWSYGVAGERSGSAQSGICTIDAGTGAVSATGTAVAGDVCIVTATASATGYTDKAAPTVSLTVSAQEALTITWTGYTPSSLTWAAGGVTAPSITTFAVEDSDGTAVESGISKTFALGSGTTNNSCTVVSTSGALTIAGAGICEVILTVADNNPNNEESYATQTETTTVTILKGVQTIAVAANPYGASPTLNVGGADLSLENAPTGGQTSLALEYQSVDTAVCTVGSATGTVSPVTTGTCTVQARRAEGANFDPSDWVQMLSLTVGPGTFTALARGGIPSAGTVGVPVDLASQQPVSTPAADSYTITVTSGDCAYTGTTLSFTGTTECVLSVTAIKTDYTAKTETFRITVGAGALGSISWGSFTGTLVVGGDSKAPSEPTGAGVGGTTNVSYALKSGSEANCDLTNANTGEVTAKAVSLTGSPICTIVGTASRDGYTPTTEDISIALSEGTMGDLTAPAYAASLAVMGTVSVTTQPSGEPDGAGWSYTVAGERSGSAQSGICTIDAGTGAVSATGTADAGDVCIVTATASATGYTDKAAPTVSLTVSAQEALTITWTGYTPSSLTWAAGGVTAPSITTVAVEDSDGTAVESGISKTFALGSGTTNNSCTVLSTSGALAIAGAGTCEVVLTVADNDPNNEESYATNTETTTVTIGKGAQTITVPANPYGASPTLNVGGGDLSVENSPTGGETSLALEYQSLDENICTVNSSSGIISPVTTGTCTIQVRRVGGTNFNPSDWEEMVELEVDPGSFAPKSQLDHLPRLRNCRDSHQLERQSSRVQSGGRVRRRHHIGKLRLRPHRPNVELHQHGHLHGGSDRLQGSLRRYHRNVHGYSGSRYVAI